MKSFTLYLIHKEGKTSVGMYRSVMAGALDDTARHPTPSKDSGLIYNGYDHYARTDRRDFYYGFSSIEQLRRWVYPDQWLRSLHEEGYVLSTFQSLGYTGYTQAVAHKDHMEIIETTSLLDLIQTAPEALQ
jgi:hypothetical protein